MAIRITDNGAAALYNSVGMVAFGPIFESSEHAEDFLRWASEKGYNPREVRLNEVRPAKLLDLHTAWMKARLDDDGYLKLIEN